MIKAPRGLEGVIVASTELTKIDGQNGRLIYRGYDISELAGIVPYEHVAHLFWYGHLPSPEEAQRLDRILRANRDLPVEVEDFLAGESKNAEPLSAVQTAISLLGGLDRRKDRPAVETSILLNAKMPTILSQYWRFKKESSILAPNPQLDHAANYLYMLTGRVPSQAHAHAMDAYFTLLADHGISASTFVARIAASTLTDVYSSEVAAISALKGPLHGGAPIYVWEMLQSIGKPENAEKWLTNKLQRDERIMGFGHRVYRAEDPRSKILKQLAKQLVEPELFGLATTVEATAKRLLHEAHPERVLDTNVEFYSSLVLHAVGVPPELFTSTFASARTVGWTAHIIEQLSDNRLFRPAAEYKGPTDLHVKTENQAVVQHRLTSD